MIFNTRDYYFLFLLPSAMLFRVLNARYRPLVILASGSLFFSVFFLHTVGWNDRCRLSGHFPVGVSGQQILQAWIVVLRGWGDPDDIVFGCLQVSEFPDESRLANSSA